MIDNIYTQRDTEEIKERIKEYLKRETDKLTDFTDASLITKFINVLAGVSDYMQFYLDNQAYETNLMTARIPKNIRANCEALNYKIEQVGSAEGIATISIDNTFGGEGEFLPYIPPVEVPAGTLVYSEEPEIPYVTQDTLIFQTEHSLDVKVIQGTPRDINVTSEYLKQSFRYYISTNKKIPFKTVTIKQGDVYWTRVDDAYLELEGGKKFSVHNDADLGTYILFTYDWKEQLPADNSEVIVISYLESLGTEGTLKPGELKIVKGPIYDGQGTDISKSMYVNNELPTSGAFDEPNLQECKARTRKNLMTMDRNITLNDYIASAEKLPQFCKVLAHDWCSDIELVDQPFLIKMWLVPQDLDIDNLPEKIYYDDVANELVSKGVTYQRLSVETADFVDLFLNVRIKMRGEGEYRENVRKQVEETLNSKFSFKNCEFGEKVPRIDYADIESIVYRVSSDITEVNVDYRLLEGNRIFTEVVLTPTQFPIFHFIATLEGGTFGE